jgi:hypothetical protein
MRCERFTTCVLVFLIAACSRETPEPSGAAPAPGAVKQPAAEAAAAPLESPSYAQAMTWLKSNRGFHFVIEEGGTRAEGNMTRMTPGAEMVRFKANGEEWQAHAGRAGVTWLRRAGSKWEVATPPAIANRLYQRVTLAIDPQKKEGEAQLIEPGHFRFTNANSGDVHDVWLDDKGRVTKMTIGKTMELVITNPV